jgi:hypothetical protein
MQRIHANAAVVLAFAVAQAATAHHSPAGFDRSKEVLFEGTLTRFEFSNPHTYLTIEIVGPAGVPSSQTIEAGPVSTIQPLGLTRDALKVGDRVVVKANPSRRGPGRTALGLEVTRPDGTVLPLFVTSRSVRPPSSALATSISGMWRPTVAGFMALNAAVDSWPLTDLGRERIAAARSENRTTHSNCVPAGAPMLMVYPVATNVSLDAATVVFDIDWLDARRVVHLEAAHPRLLEPTLQGHSIGRWEGDTLIVDTVGFAAHDEGIGFGLPSSEAKHLIERFTLSDDRRHLVYDVTVEDPAHISQPVRHTAQWEYSPDLEPSYVKCDLEVARRYLHEDGQP